MTADEFDIRQTARDLKQLYAAMDELKHIPNRPAEVRTMRPAPGPQSPGNWLWINRAVTMEQRLREICFNALGDLGIKLKDGDARVERLLEIAGFNAQLISELQWAQDFLDELEDQARAIGRWVNPPEPAETAKRLEPYHRAEIIIQRAAQHGHTLTRDGLRKLAERSNGEISTERWGGRTTYRFTEVLNHLRRRAKG